MCLVAAEAVRTLQFSGCRANLICDVGVAGIHRLFDRLDEIKSHDIVIAVAGWDAALASVLGGLVAQPVIAVPTSAGYGVAKGGQTALNSMLASCGQGVLGDQYRQWLWRGLRGLAHLEPACANAREQRAEKDRTFIDGDASSPISKGSFAPL